MFESFKLSYDIGKEDMTTATPIPIRVRRKSKWVIIVYGVGQEYWTGRFTYLRSSRDAYVDLKDGDPSSTSYNGGWDGGRGYFKEKL